MRKGGAGLPKDIPMLPLELAMLGRDEIRDLDNPLGYTTNLVFLRHAARCWREGSAGVPPDLATNKIERINRATLDLRAEDFARRPTALEWARLRARLGLPERYDRSPPLYEGGFP